MPMKWVDPEAFCRVERGDEIVVVYHAYKDNDFSRRLTFHYTLNHLNDDEDGFDVRDLDLVKQNWNDMKDKVLTGDLKAIKKVIKEAVRLGHLNPPPEE